jgi:hypothetical protein
MLINVVVLLFPFGWFKGTESVAEETQRKICMKLNEDGIKVNSFDDYHGEVKVDVQNWDNCLRLLTNRLTIADWNFQTDITEINEKKVSTSFNITLRLFSLQERPSG